MDLVFVLQWVRSVTDFLLWIFHPIDKIITGSTGEATDQEMLAPDCS